MGRTSLPYGEGDSPAERAQEKMGAGLSGALERVRRALPAGALS